MGDRGFTIDHGIHSVSEQSFFPPKFATELRAGTDGLELTTVS